ncbi:MAG: hypothetical protein IPN81_13260 [Nitrosomonadales bacterium]|nr:hypothetical protein [Nitrosomonadales bacterium]
MKNWVYTDRKGKLGEVGKTRIGYLSPAAFTQQYYEICSLLNSLDSMIANRPQPIPKTALLSF